MNPEFDVLLSFADISEFDPIEDLPLFLSGVYVFLNEQGKLIYVGQSKDVHGRVRRHKTERKWKEEIASVFVKRIADIDSRLVLESLIFLKYRPVHNRTIKLSKRNDGTLFECQFLRFTPKSNTKKTARQGKSVKN